MTTPYILPAEASTVGKYRGICDWADRPTTFNSTGDWIRVSDQALALYVWNGTEWTNSVELASLAAPGPIGGTTPDTGAFTDITADTVATAAATVTTLSATNATNATITATAPASASATGTAGEIRTDASYIYVCTATDTWKRAAIATWA